jgi:hypothetical protein
MKKIILIAAVLMCLTTFAGAALFVSAGGDDMMLGKNDLLGKDGANATVYTGSIGWAFDSGFTAAMLYDHLDMEDYIVNVQNARVIAPIPSLGLGYRAGFENNKYLWWTTAGAGFAPVRYRLNVTDYRSSAFAPSIRTAGYYRIDGQFYAGIEAGYRYLKTNFSDIPGKELDLSGLFAGISLMFVLE